MNRKVNIIVPKDAVETYNSPSHNREEYNEIVIETVFSEPDEEILKAFERCGTRTELWENLPSRLAYTGDL